MYAADGGASGGKRDATFPARDSPHPPDLQWLAMDTGSMRRIKGVAIQGRGNGKASHWVTHFKVDVSYSSHSGYSWVDGGRTFAGNTGNGEVIVRANLSSVVTVRYVRIHPTTLDQYPMMRCGVYLESC